MPKSNVFLEATWRDLLLLSYAVPPEQLEPYLPAGTKLHLWDGQAVASVVAFYFTDTRIKGWRIPGHVHFPEINLRFYVERTDSANPQPGVVFVREIVGRPLIAWAANHLYNERYVARWMRYSTRPRLRSVEHNYYLLAGGRLNTLRILPGTDTSVPEPDSLAHFLKERYYGYGVDEKGHLLQYHVEHPRWAIHPLLDLEMFLDYGAMFGPYWDFLNDLPPISTLFAAGSEVLVYNPQRLAF